MRSDDDEKEDEDNDGDGEDNKSEERGRLVSFITLQIREGHGGSRYKNTRTASLRIPLGEFQHSAPCLSSYTRGKFHQHGRP